MNRIDFYISLLKPGEENWGSRELPLSEQWAVTKDDAVEILTAYRNKKISYEQLFDWANLVLFNDLFEYDGDEIREMLDRIEESDEPGNEITDQVVSDLIEEMG